MADRTFAIGDIHGDLQALKRLIGKLPTLDAKDTLVFVGDYIDRGPQSKQVIDFIRHTLPKETKAKIVALRGNHEDGWLRVATGGWPEFVLPAPNGCLATLRSYTNKLHFDGDLPTKEEFASMMQADFFPEDVVNWMNELLYFHEDEHAIYVHAGLVKEKGDFQHPSKVERKQLMLWVRTMDFFQNYRGKRVVCGHTSTDHLPPELSSFTPEDPTDMWAGEAVFVIDTGCGKGGFLTALELPAVKVYESR
ncbi:MAG: serine/threonine protein phosphatase [Myxococcaceae bacterium]|nr:serine/threonine protein phosphatase [Myxococcaceae bacterium]